jgi:hypothetical protein
MGEKKGYTLKLDYPFDTSKSCEVFLPKTQTYYRVTPREFRSFGGKRRILYFNSNIPSYEEYIGPVYYYMTNMVVNKKELDDKVLFLNNTDSRGDKYQEKRLF